MILAYKPPSFTPLQLLEKIREEQPELKGVKLAYAGRLDPMAEGEMLILVGDECKDRAKYQSMDKVYEVNVAFGFATDTGDGMGMITKSHVLRVAGGEFVVGKANSQKLIANSDYLSSFVGSFDQPYPSYSSKTIDGAPLYRLAREKNIDESKIPTKRVTIYDLTILDAYEILVSEMIDDIISRVLAVQGDFRQEKIVHQWREININTKPQVKIQVVKIRVDCSSGTYMRSLAAQIGEKIGIPAFAWKIKRTKILLEKQLTP